MSPKEALCKLECGFKIAGRNIWLVTMNDGKLGIMVDEGVAIVFPIDPNAPGMSAANAPRVIIGTMGLLATAPLADQPALTACFETALVMTIVRSEKEKREMLLCIYDEESTEAILASTWTEAEALMEQVFSDADRKTVANLCILPFFNSSAISH